MHATLTIFENAALLEQDNLLAPWVWYAETYQQYKSVFFLLIELQRNAEPQEEDKANSALDYIFGSGSDITLWQCSREMLQLLRDRLTELIYTGSNLGQDRPVPSRPSTLKVSPFLWQE